MVIRTSKKEWFIVLQLIILQFHASNSGVFSSLMHLFQIIRVTLHNIHFIFLCLFVFILLTLNHTLTLFTHLFNWVKNYSRIKAMFIVLKIPQFLYFSNRNYCHCRWFLILLEREIMLEYNLGRSLCTTIKNTFPFLIVPPSPPPPLFSLSFSFLSFLFTTFFLLLYFFLFILCLSN